MLCHWCLLSTNRWSCSCRKLLLSALENPHYFRVEAGEKPWCAAVPREAREWPETPLSPAAYCNLAPPSMGRVGSAVNHSHGELTAVLTGWPPTVCFSIWFRLHLGWCCLVMCTVCSDAFHCSFPVQNAEFRGALPTNSVFLTVLCFHAILWRRKVQWQLNGVRK